jgi:hypothetical protein
MHEPDVRPAMPITPLKAAQNPPTKIAAQSPLGHMRTNETKNSKRDADVRPPRTPAPAGKTPSPAGRTTRPQPAARQSGAVQPPAAPQQPIPFRPPRGDRHPVKEPESPHSGNAKQPLAEPKIAHTLPNNNETLQRINTASQRPARTGRPEPGNAPAGPAARTVPERPVKISAPDRQPQFPTENKPHVNSLFSESKMSRPLSRDASASPQAGRTNQSARTAEAAAAGGRPRNTYIDSGPAEDAVEGAAASSGMPHYKAA